MRRQKKQVFQQHTFAVIYVCRQCVCNCMYTDADTSDTLRRRRERRVWRHLFTRHRQHHVAAAAAGVRWRHRDVIVDRTGSERNGRRRWRAEETWAEETADDESAPRQSQSTRIAVLILCLYQRSMAGGIKLSYVHECACVCVPSECFNMISRVLLDTTSPNSDCIWCGSMA